MWGFSPRRKKQRSSVNNGNSSVGGGGGLQVPTDDDSELPSSSAPLPEFAPLVAAPPPTPITKQAHNVSVGSEVWTGLLAEDDNDDINDVHNKSTDEMDISSEEDPWKAYVSQKNLDVGSLTTIQQQALDTTWNFEDEMEPARGLLPEDTFAFLATCDVRSKAFFVAICTMATQLIVLCLLAVDSITFTRQDDELPRNTLSVPATSVMQVSISQFLALMIASVSQTDCLQSLMLLHYGYQEHRVREVLDIDNQFNMPSWLQFRWYLSIAARFIVGFFTGIVTFLLVVRSETVRDGTL